MVTEPATPSRSESVRETARGQLPYGEEIIRPGPLNFTSLFIPFFENFLLTTAFSLIPGRQERGGAGGRGGRGEKSGCGGGQWWHERLSAVSGREERGVFVPSWMSGFLTHTHTHSRAHAYMHAHIHACTHIINSDKSRRH